VTAVSLLLVGHGGRQVLLGSRRGEVHSAFRKAAYLRLEAGLVAVTGPGVPPGPLHLCSERLGAHRVGEVVLVTPDLLTVGAVTYDLAAPDWDPVLPTSMALHAGRETLLRATRHLAAPDLDLGAGCLGGGRRSLPTGVADAVRRGDLAGLRRLVTGRGPGLTPAGDDLLAGVLLYASGLWGESGWAELSAGADGSATGDIAAAFLYWAARGSCVQPAHALVHGAGRRDDAAAEAAMRALAGIGGSSGRDLAFGVRLAARWLPAQPTSRQDVAGACTQNSLAARLPGFDHDSGRLANTCSVSPLRKA
jgi:hypothetical protein